MTREEFSNVVRRLQVLQSISLGSGLVFSLTTYIDEDGNGVINVHLGESEYKFCERADKVSLCEIIELVESYG